MICSLASYIASIQVLKQQTQLSIGKNQSLGAKINPFFILFYFLSWLYQEYFFSYSKRKSTQLGINLPDKIV